ncbi:uncharacterized protein EAE98_003066 [Botrytis deweyae]|uniref:GS catalytic domain-containing protein n=1 Tax=Botrytis deweyae TaxID=2478750 RepID=A0ABQ7IVV6_9HELO|nr:uncharacterized protein EAE98_003066 [Botrytis deweyae]KAF7935021.1 hypothetical protein EAE98_003066 [Botrytis deweyae]
MERLVRAIRTTPLIDSRARPLLIPSSKTRHSLLGITTKGNGDALKASRSTLAHIRATNQLADILGCPPTWNDVLEAIEKENEKLGDAWIKQCLKGIETVLLDCLSTENQTFDYFLHGSSTRSKCKRIVRIESLAADIVNQNIMLFAISEDKFFNSVVEELQKGINDAISDTDVVGFISAICYRPKLDIAWVCPLELIKSTLMQCIWKPQNEGHIRFKGFDGQILNSWIIHMTALLIRESESSHKKPIQFHTSLGDDELPLTRSLPSHLEDFIREYSDVPIVLVHSCYPWTKEAGYLATIHSNVYVDIGEVFPCVSQDGQEGVIRDLLELCPTEKIVWSSDGHDFPETYLLAQIQSREAFERVLVEYVTKKALTVQQAVEVVENIFFNTSNQLYALQSKLRPMKIKDVDQSLNGLDETTLVNGVNGTKDVYHTNGICTIDIINGTNGVNGRNTMNGTNGTNGNKSTSHADISENPSDLELFESFMAQHPGIKFLRVQYVDYCSITRLRILPIKRVRNLLCDEKVDVSIGITNSSLTLTPVDHRIDSVSPRGVSRLLTAVPSSMRPGPCHGYASAQGELRNSDNSPLDVCPRTNLRNIVNRAKNHGLEFLVGFEIEVIFMKGTLNEDNTHVYVPLPGSDSHCWGSNNALSPAVINVMDEIIEKLSDAGIDLEQWHPESATGQFEFVLPACAPLEAADILLQTREIIAAVAQTHGWRATLHPKPLPSKMGTGAHVHLSIPTPEGEKEQTYTHFYAGILKHLRAITAFTYGNPASYDRMLAARGWAGSTWVTWGTQNRETALRKIDGSHWELRCMDGLANVYLALSAIIGAGVEGVVSKDKMTWLDCDMNPAKLSQADRDVYNIEEMLPCTLEEALTALRIDQGMYKILGEAVVVTYIAMKRGELELMNSMKDEQRRNWMIERY